MGNEVSGGAEHWAATPEMARRRRRERREQQRQSSTTEVGEEEKKRRQTERMRAVEMNMSARAILALQGRKLFSDFHDAQADYARKWGEERGSTKGISELFETEAPGLASRYEILEAIACGVTAVVCLARSKETQEVVAVKFVRIRVQGLSDAVRRHDCKEEARLQMMCNHKNVVRLIDFEMGKTFALYVMEYVERTLLQKIVERNDQEEYSERVAAGYIRDIASALFHTHSRGVVHMDVKLDNVLCTKDNVAKLCDFGVAEQMRYSNTPIRRTVAAPLFAPPEIYLTGYCTTQADMWSLGVILYILLCGYPPFKESELQERIMHARYTFPERDWAGVSIMARDLISRLLVLDTNVRYTAQQVLDHPWIRAVGKVHSAPANSSRVPAEFPSAIEKTESLESRDTDKGDANSIEEDSFPSGASIAASAPVIRDAAELDPDLLPLPLRVTRFLRNMHHYRELEKRGFENVPGGSLYRDILNGVDEITVGISKKSESGESPLPSWLSRQVKKTLETSPTDKSADDTEKNSYVSGFFSGIENYYYPEENDISDSYRSEAEKHHREGEEETQDAQVKAHVSEGDTLELTDKDIYAQARFRRRMSSAASKGDLPRTGSRRRVRREKSFDVRPESAPDWIKDNEAISCRICDKEFTVFIRKHHCRSCGGIFCDSCCKKRIRLDLLDTKEPVRVCRLCVPHYPIETLKQDEPPKPKLSASHAALHRYQDSKRR